MLNLGKRRVRFSHLKNTFVKIIDQYRCEKVVYISCKPTSLARDLQAFQAGGYEVERVCCIDQFPNTVHIETVCLLRLKH